MDDIEEEFDEVYMRNYNAKCNTCFAEAEECFFRSEKVSKKRIKEIRDRIEHKGRCKYYTEGMKTK